jgi:hypothetical protein
MQIPVSTSDQSRAWRWIRRAPRAPVTRAAACREARQPFRLVVTRPEDKTASDFAHDLERRLPVCQRRRLHNRTTVWAGLGIGGLQKHAAAFQAGDAPQRTAAAYQRPDGNLSRRRSMLDVPIWEPKGEDRRRRDTASLSGPWPLRGFRWIGLLVLDGRDAVVVIRITVHTRLGRRVDPRLAEQERKLEHVLVAHGKRQRASFALRRWS